MSKWQDGELLHTLHYERQWRLNGYEPFTPKATIKDAVKIDKDLAKEYPNEYGLKDQSNLTQIALDRLEELE